MTRRLVLLHGFLGHAADWIPQLERLPAAHSGSALFLPGHGPQPGAVPADFAGCVAWLAARLEALEDGPLDLVGYSMGGRLALALALERPGLLRRVVAVGASPGIEDAGERAARAARDEERAAALEAGPFEDWLEAWYAQPLFAGLRAAPGFGAVRALRLQGRPPSLAAALRALSVGRQPPLRHRLADCAVPLLLMAGAEDAKYAASNRDLARLSPTIAAVTVPAAGHAPHLEQPDEFHRILREWLERP